MSELGGSWVVRPDQIEERSFEIIGREMGLHGFTDQEEQVVKRVIHTTADFDYVHNLRFSAGAVAAGVAALGEGATVVTDTTMVAAGINKRALASRGGSVRTFIADVDVADEARLRGVTRSAVAMERASGLPGPLVFAIGNAPTALVRLSDLVVAGEMAPPALVIGVPVGFVNVVEAKELMCATPVESIVALGRKGGSNVAAAIVNALLYLAVPDRGAGGASPARR